MKQILFILLAAISFSSQAQQNKQAIISSWNHEYSFSAALKEGSDTLYLETSNKVHFIKIEGEIYEITRKTELKKVEPKSMNSEWFAVPNYNDPMPNYNAPMYGGNGFLTDRSTNDTILIYNANKGEWMNPPKKKSKKK